jgi:hypothetical protein
VVNTVSPKEIYAVILVEVGKLLHSFSECEEEEEELKKARQEALKKLTASQEEIKHSLAQLQKNAEWDLFTIAFYGETNAGKSTLIETLRIMLAEPEKMKERQEFRRLLEEYNKFYSDVEACRLSIKKIEDEYKDKIEDIEKTLKDSSEQMQKISDAIMSFKLELGRLNDAAKNEKTISIANFLRYIFGKLSVQKDAKKCKGALLKKEAEAVNMKLLQKKLTKSRNTLTDKLQNSKGKLLKNLEELIARTEPYSVQMTAKADGKIIGDGRSDYTQTVTGYSFEVDNQKFSLLDLPGIEGNEGHVLDTINNAVEKAHAVFYVTGKPTPPQTGDKQTEGTLEKIKKHLGEQTEVYTIFNKRVKNPMQLRDQLVDEDESESLKVLDKTMRTHLGEQYKKTIPVSAYPAFLAVANCWHSDYETKQKKFIGHFNSPQALLKKTRMENFAAWFTADIVNNCKAKIKKANFKKAAGVIDATATEVRQIHKQFLEFQKELVKTKKSTDSQLDDEAEMLRNRLDAESHAAIENFKNDMRRKIYSDIDTEINNDEFKAAFKNRVDESVESLQPKLEQRFKSVIEEFKNGVTEVIKKYQKYAQELLRSYTGAGKFDTKFELKINMKSNVNWVSLVSSVVGGIVGVIILISNPAGWVVLAISILGALISIGKAIAGVFDHKYRASQQRKTADENIEKVGRTIQKDISKNLAEAYMPLQAGIRDIKRELMKSVSSVTTINEILQNAGSKFAKMAVDIRIESERSS